MIDPRALRRLAAMDIQVWRARAPRSGRAVDERPTEAASGKGYRPAEASSTGGSRPSGRIRLEAGGGPWLLVVDDADRDRHSTLIEDIRAALGSRDCRFGTWSDSAEAGVAPADWDAHGIRHALVLGGEAGGRGAGDSAGDSAGDCDSAFNNGAFIDGGDLARLSASGEARRALWRQLEPLLAARER